MIKVFDVIQNDTVVVFEKRPSVAQGKLMELPLNYRINIVYEHYHWVIYKMLFRKELKPNLNSE